MNTFFKTTLSGDAGLKKPYRFLIQARLQENNLNLRLSSDSDKALVNQRKEAIRFNEWTLNTRGTTKCLYIDLSLRDLSI